MQCVTVTLVIFTSSTDFTPNHVYVCYTIKFGCDDIILLSHALAAVLHDTQDYLFVKKSVTVYLSLCLINLALV